MSSFRLAGIQPRVAEGTSTNLRNVVRCIRRAASASPDIICLPEAWLNGFTRPLDLKRLARSAEEASCYLVCGGLWERLRGKDLVTCPVIAPDGHILGRQVKTHLFGGERRKFSPGDGIEVFKVRKVRIGCAICHDIVFPEVTREMALRGAEVIFNPSKIVEEGVRPWQRYVAVRSLENRIPILGVNVVMRSDGRRYPGRSVAVSPIHVKEGIYDVKVQSLTRGPGTLICDIDLRALSRTRRERLKEMRRGLYAAR